MPVITTEKATGVTVDPAAAAFVESDRGLLIGGEEVTAASGAELAVVDPGTGEPIGRVSAAGAADVDQAVRVASDAYATWSATAPQERERLMNRLAALVEDHARELAVLEVLDTGKPLRNARAEVGLAAATFRYYAGWPTKLHGETNPTGDHVFSYTVREPVGVCGLITAWNYPLLLASWKVAPALAFGNTAVLKPAEQTPLTSLRLGALAIEAGFPPGVLNVVPGDGPGAGQSLVDHPDVAKLAFTGSTAVGRAIGARAAEGLKRVTLELGGKSPNVVFADADLDVAAAGAVRAIFWNSGQVCVAGSRLFVERSVADDLVEAIVERTGRLELGHGLVPGTEMGPLVSPEHRDRVRGYVEAGRQEGATLAAGGSSPDMAGYFLEPTVFTGVDNGMRIAREEIFGPVLAVIPFDGMDELVTLANDTPYGLAAAVWTNDVSRAHRLARQIRAGTVWINTFGVLEASVSFGGFKQSGLGRELGPHSVDAYTEIKSVYVGG